MQACEWILASMRRASKLPLELKEVHIDEMHCVFGVEHNEHLRTSETCLKTTNNRQLARTMRSKMLLMTK